jgi:heme-degrading monooxygenase HmoA
MSVFRVVLEMEVAAGDSERFEQAWLDAAESFVDAPGMISQTLATASDDGRRFTITSDWTDEQHFHRFEVSSRQHDCTATLRALRTSSVMRTQDVRAVVLREAHTTALTLEASR